MEVWKVGRICLPFRVAPRFGLYSPCSSPCTVQCFFVFSGSQTESRRRVKKKKSEGLNLCFIRVLFKCLKIMKSIKIVKKDSREFSWLKSVMTCFATYDLGIWPYKCPQITKIALNRQKRLSRDGFRGFSERFQRGVLQISKPSAVLEDFRGIQGFPETLNLS